MFRRASILFLSMIIALTAVGCIVEPGPGRHPGHPHHSSKHRRHSGGEHHGGHGEGHGRGHGHGHDRH